jgi:hypothetical protein
VDEMSRQRWETKKLYTVDADGRRMDQKRRRHDITLIYLNHDTISHDGVETTTLLRELTSKHSLRLAYSMRTSVSTSQVND